MYMDQSLMKVFLEFFKLSVEWFIFKDLIVYSTYELKRGAAYKMEEWRLCNSIVNLTCLVLFYT